MKKNWMKRDKKSRLERGWEGDLLYGAVPTPSTVRVELQFLSKDWRVEFQQNTLLTGYCALLVLTRKHGSTNRTHCSPCVLCTASPDKETRKHKQNTLRTILCTVCRASPNKQTHRQSRRKGVESSNRKQIDIWTEETQIQILSEAVSGCNHLLTNLSVFWKLKQIRQHIY